MNDFLAKTMLWVAREISELLIVYLSFAFFLPSFFLLFSRLFANNDFSMKSYTSLLYMCAEYLYLKGNFYHFFFKFLLAKKIRGVK